MDLSDLKEKGLAQPITIQGRQGWKLVPTSAEQTAQLLLACQEDKQLIALNKLDAELLDNPVWLDISKLKKVRHYHPPDFVIQVETGLTFGKLASILTEQNQALPLSYPPDTLLLDILAEERHALETGLRGYLRDIVLKTEIATPDGQLTISGADVVKNVTGYDLHKLYVGGHNAFGVITSVTFKLSALPKSRQNWQYHALPMDTALALSQKLARSPLPLTTCELIQDSENPSHWDLLGSVAGDPAILADCESALQQASGHVPESITAITQFPEKSCLTKTSPDIITAALPSGEWPDFVRTLATQAQFAGLSMRVRPAAGLVFISAPQISLALLEYLQAEAERRGGFLRIQASPNIEPDWVGRFNLPANPMVRNLLKRLKNSYDPQGILFTPQLPL